MGSALNLGLQPDDRWLALLPFFHVGGLAILHKARGVGHGHGDFVAFGIFDRQSLPVDG